MAGGGVGDWVIDGVGSWKATCADGFQLVGSCAMVGAKVVAMGDMVGDWVGDVSSMTISSLVKEVW